MSFLQGTPQRGRLRGRDKDATVHVPGCLDKTLLFCHRSHVPLANKTTAILFVQAGRIQGMAPASNRVINRTI